MGYLVKLDTNGSNPKVVKKLIEEKLIDYIAMDVKNSIELYPLTTGVNNQEYINNVLETINILKQNQVDYEFRTTLIDEFHSKESIEKIGELLKGANKIYLQKFIDRGTCIQDALHEVQIKKALEYKCILEKYIPIVNLRGY
jgi:pyruvate formate lyase activating enzyme